MLSHVEETNRWDQTAKHQRQHALNGDVEVQFLLQNDST